jgi:hypothetical protein
MYYLAVMINIFGSLYAMGLMIDLSRRYEMKWDIGMYVFSSIVAMLVIALSMMYFLTVPPVQPFYYRLATVIFWAPKIFLVYALRKRSLLKKEDSEIRFSNQNNKKDESNIQ